MSSLAPVQHGEIIFLSIILAMLMMLLPLPGVMQYARPEWVIMTLIYWAMALPHRVGVGVAWFTGLVVDLTSGGTLGVMAFAYALVIFLVARLHLQIRQYPLWQQATLILSLVFLVHMISVLTSSVTNQAHLWLPVVSSTILWPVVYAVLRNARRVFNVT